MPRNSIACEPCRARKVKCHPPFPCRKCIDMGMEHACTSRSKARPNRVSQVFSASKQKANLEPQKPSFSNPDLVDGRNTALRVIDQVFSQHFGSLLQSKSSPERRSPQPSPDSNREAFLRRLSTADPPRPALLPTFRTRPIIDHFMQNAKSLVPWMESSYVQSVIQKAWNGQYDGSNIGQAVGPASKERDACAHMIFALGLYFEDINKNYGVAHGQVGDDDYEAQSGKDRDIGTSGSVDRLFDDVVHFCQSLSLSREEEQPSVTGMNTALMQFLYAFFIGCYDFAQEAIFKSFKICVSLQARDTSQNNMAFYGRAFFQVAFSDL
ncbi:hypothetical protein IE53DRAFT_204886 [Violaceomyces palustris]|uniref:Uncharacterized protein n=1 Tax=Violaceomyces palustris TaxID=1673888 RepID=A0ACD0NR74_9BASI|nr:hypothetical protein IE53DRAFT_204886 [Violaceomyces palustris]